MPPVVDEALPETCCGRVKAGQKDGATATKPVVKGNREPAANDGAAEVGTGIGETEKPGGVVTGDAEVLRVEDLGAVHDGFICGRAI